LTDQAPPSDAPSGAPGAERDAVLRNVVIHLNNEQPVLADLFEMPSASDVAILCTNMRTPDGKRPVFIDHSESTFLLPLAHIRFIEMPGPSGQKVDDPGSGQAGPGRHRASHQAPPAEADLEIDEEFLRRIRDA
jgi:hypothetical protein